MKVTKGHLIQQLSKKHKITNRESRQIITSLLEIIFNEIAKGNDVRLPTLGTLVQKEHQARKAGNARDNGWHMIPSALRLKLRVSAQIKAALKQLHQQSFIEKTSFFQ